MSLTFVNQVGAPNGLNQAAPGIFIPETFVRWSQDILFDRVGELRRRAPFKTLGLFNEAGTALAQPSTNNERVIGLVSTRNPNNENRIGIIVTDGSSSRVLFYDDKYRKTCFCDIEGVAQDTIVFSRPALDGGVFIGLLENYGAIAGGTIKNLLYYWRGGTGTGGYAVNTATLGLNTSTVNELTVDYSHSGTLFTSSTPHGLAAGYKLFVTNVGTGSGTDPWPLTTTTPLTVSASGLTSTEFQVTETASSNEDRTGIKMVVQGHVSHNDTITDTFDTTKITPGMFAYRVVGGTYDSGTNTIAGGTDYYLGVVKQATNTTVTLEKDIIRTFGLNTSPYGSNTNQQVRFVNIRPYIHNHGRGLITRETHGFTVTSGSVGTEGEGHFASAGLAESPGWALYRASDGEWLGDVQSVTNNAALTLDSVYHSDNVPMNADEYVARRYAPIYEGNDADKYPGVFNTTYAGYQWYGNGGSPGTENRIVFSAYHDPESVDLSKDAADSIIIPGTQQMRGIATSATGLLIFLEDKTYLLRGNYRANFSLEELYPEGCLSAQSIVEYGGGVFWAAKNGILFYDGATVRNLTETNLGSYYTDSIKTFEANKRRIFSFFYKDYLFVTFTGFASSFSPKRYEPLYVDTVNDSPSGFTVEQIQALDPSFTSDDLRVENNVPIYWKQYSMYSSASGDAQQSSGVWSAGKSFPNADITSTTTVTLDASFALSTFTGTAAASTDIISSTAHGLVNGTILRFTTGVTGITTGTTNYYVTNSATDTFQIATDPEGTSIVDITADGSVAGVILPGDRVIGPGIPTDTLVDTVSSSTSFTLDTASTNASDITIQLIPNAPINTWSKVYTFVWGPINFIESMTFAVYLPNNAVTAISNFDFRGFIKLDSTTTGTRGYAGINAVNPDNLTGTYARVIDVDSMLEYNNKHKIVEDSELSENFGKNPSLYYKGPDFYLQTKNYPVGDPVIKKWFRQLMLNLYLHDGGVRMDIVDSEDNDYIDIIKKRRRNWDIFGEAGYSWNNWERNIVNTLTSPNPPIWNNLKDSVPDETTWYEITDAEFERRKKKISWRYPSVGFRLYQMNNYRPSNYQNPQRPHIVKVDSWNIGFKPLRTSRI